MANANVNPRKFSDKIALQNQKQVEGTAAFEAILREVSATRNAAGPAVPDTQQLQQQQQQQHYLQLTQPLLASCRGRSLPNVNQIANTSIDLQGALSSLEDMKQAVNGVHSTFNKGHSRDRFSDTGQQIQKRPSSRDRHRDSSPYGSVCYLSPPSDSNWRRASSDSALHSSVVTFPMQTGPMTNGQHVPSDNNINIWTYNTVDTSQGQDQKMLSSSRPRSCEVPGISVYSSNELQPQQCAMNTSSTGSLPDLMNAVNFAAPLIAPIDGLHDSNLPTYDMATGGQQQTKVTMVAHRPQPLVLCDAARMGGSTIMVVPQVDNENVTDSGRQARTSCSTRGSPKTCESPRMGNGCVFSPMSPQPMITLTEIGPNGGTARDHVLYSEDFDAIQDYLLNSDSPMVSMSPSWLQQPTSLQNPLNVAPTPPSVGRTQSNIVDVPESGCRVRDAQSTSKQTNRPESNNRPNYANRNEGSGAVLTDLGCYGVLVPQQLQQIQLRLQQHQQPATQSQQQQQWQQVPMQFAEQQVQQSNAQTLLSNIQQQNFQQQQQPLHLGFQQQPLQHNLARQPVQQQPLQHVLQQQQTLQSSLQHHQQPMQMQQQMLPQNVQQQQQATVVPNILFVQTSLPVSSPPGVQQWLQTTESLMSAPQCSLPLDSTSGVDRLDVSMITGDELSAYANQALATLLAADNSDAGLNVSNSTTSGHPNGSHLVSVPSISSLTERDILSGLGDSFETDLYTAEEAFKFGLNPLEVEELQMLSDQNIITDPETEDLFKMDHRFVQ